MTGTRKWKKKRKKNDEKLGEGDVIYTMGKGSECINEYGAYGETGVASGQGGHFTFHLLFIAGGFWGTVIRRISFRFFTSFASLDPAAISGSPSLIPTCGAGTRKGGLFRGVSVWTFCDTPVFIPSLFRFSCFVSYQSSLFLTAGFGNLFS